MLWHKWLRSRVLTGSVQVWYRLGSPHDMPMIRITPIPAIQSPVTCGCHNLRDIVQTQPGNNLHSSLSRDTINLTLCFWFCLTPPLNLNKTFPEMCTLPAVLGLQSSGDKKGSSKGSSNQPTLRPLGPARLRSILLRRFVSCAHLCNSVYTRSQ